MDKLLGYKPNEFVPQSLEAAIGCCGMYGAHGGFASAKPSLHDSTAAGRKGCRRII